MIDSTGGSQAAPESVAVSAGSWSWRLTGTVILLVGILGFAALRAMRPVPVISEAPAYVPLVEVTAIELLRGPVEITGNGFVRPRADVVLAAQVSGEVVVVSPALVTGGSFNAGAQLVQIDPRAYAADLAQVEASKRSAQSNLEYVTKQIDRSRDLLDRGLASEERLDDWVNQRDQTAAEIDRLKALIVRRGLDLEHTSLTAPFTGRVLAEQIDVGDVVQPGQELARLYATDAVEIVVPLNHADAALLPDLWATGKPGTTPRRAEVTIAFGGGVYRWDGFLHRAEAGIDPGTRTVDVVVRVIDPFRPGTRSGPAAELLPGSAPPLLIGTYAGVTIEGMELEDYFVLPAGIVRDDDTLWTLADDSRIRIIPVQRIRDSGERVVLMSAEIRDGTPVVTSDLAVVTEGMTVRVAGESR